MKKILFFATVLFFAACGSGNDANSDKENKDSVYVVPVEVQEIAYEPFAHKFSATGNVEAIDEAYISPEMSGVVKDIYVKEGKYVQKGELLSKLSTSITEATIEEVKTGLKLAEILLEKQEKLWVEQKIGTELQYLEAESQVDQLNAKLKTLESQLSLSYVRSPISGIVDQVMIKKGELASPGRPIMFVLDLRNLYINAEVPESYLPYIKKGDPVDVSFPSYPEIEYKLKVYLTGNIINPENRTFRIRLKLKNKDKLIKPNSVASVTINDFSTDSAMVIAARIIKEDKKGSYIYLAKEEKGKLIARKTFIKKEKAMNDNIMITGINPGDKVIVKGYNLVSNGSPVKIENKKKAQKSSK